MTPFPESLRPSKTRRPYLGPSTPEKALVNGCPNPILLPNGTRDVSLSAAMKGLSLRTGSGDQPAREQSPSRLPRPVTPAPKVPAAPPFPSYSLKPQKSPRKFKQFLTRFSNTPAWDTQEQYENMERMWSDMYAKMNQTVNDTADMKGSINIYKSSSTSYPKIRETLQALLPSGASPESVAQLTYLFSPLVAELEKARAELTETNTCLRSELETAKYRISEAERIRETASRDHDIELDDLGRQHRIETENVKQDARQDLERLKTDHREELRDVKRRLEDDLEKERSQRIQALSQLSTQGALDKQQQELEVDAKDREIRVARAESERIAADLERERALCVDLRQSLSNAASNAITMEAARQALQAKIEYLESDSKSQSEAYATMERQMREAIEEAQELQEKLRKEETLRRKLHNQVQELKGNIRVFCRVRPTLSMDAADEQAKIAYPDDGEDAKEIDVRGPEEKSSLGTVTTKKYPFAFDRVFGPDSHNQQVFEEISQLIQSALDGYNVCIFCYGQTGSGKTYTMSSEDGMIPRAVHMIYDTAQGLEDRGWKYKMEGSFVEVYNENLNDLLGRPDDFDKKKHEIRHDMQTCKTTITDITSAALDSPEKVEEILAQAMSNRSVAATKANERSSRSHSVFILKLSGHNSITGERSEGTLNLVDLAGSERLSQSKVEGARLKETQSINRSLSCLGDVIGALGQGKDGGHIPYRNSKLTYLLQFSLGGNSKTLMFCMISPLQAHLGETLTSLRFATKVRLCLAARWRER
jgi:kinesin family member C1